MKMKKILFVAACISQLNAWSQISDWYKVDLSRIGYKNTKLTFENYPISNTLTDGDFQQTTIKGGSFEMSADIYTKHMYFSIDGSSFLDIGATLFQFDKSKQRWFDNDEYFVLRSDILPVRLAFGSNIGKYVGVYVGGQYALSSVGLQYRSGSSVNYRDTRIGGNTYGIGGHLVAAYKFLNVRYSYMYNLQSQARIFKGRGITNECVVSVGWANVGLFTKFTHIYSTTHGGYLPKDRSKLFNNAYNNVSKDNYTWQSSHFASQFQFSIGIYGAGLFSGISKVGSRALFETEQGVAKERREEKRRKVEYQD